MRQPYRPPDGPTTVLDTPSTPEGHPAAVSLVTLRFGPDDPTCLIPGLQHGVVGRTLCGTDLFGPTTPTWTTRGRHTNPAWCFKPCDGCVDVARRTYPGVSVVGVPLVAEPVAAALGVPVRPDVLPAPSTP